MNSKSQSFWCINHVTSFAKIFNQTEHKLPASEAERIIICEGIGTTRP